MQPVAKRATLFVGITALSVPLAPASMLVLNPLQQLISPWPVGPFWDFLDAFVFDLPLTWSFLVLAPGAEVLVDGNVLLGVRAILISLAFWTIVGVGYGWLTRRVRLPYVGLGILPVVWIVGFLTIVLRG